MILVLMHVISCLGGGLGNQLFQYAAGRSLAMRTGARLMLDTSRIEPLAAYRYVLSNLAIDAELIHGRDCGEAANKFRNMAEEHLGSPIFRERSYAYDPRFEGLVPPTILVGFWESEKYFHSTAGTLRAELRLVAPPGGENARWLAEIGSANAVCVHVRQGAKSAALAMKTHGPCSVAYYERAMAHMRTNVRQPKFFMFADNREWARKNLAAPDTVVVDANGAEAADQELRLMSACRHHIIANSTLSWWGAWLGAHESQIVIAPDPWFATGRPTPDLLPERWLRISRN